MQVESITKYRMEAEECYRQSQLTSDAAAKLHWLTLSQAWLLLANNMMKLHVDEAFGGSFHSQFMPRPATMH
jgi:hypothetical protein